MVPDDAQLADDPAFETDEAMVSKHRFKNEDEEKIREYLRRRHATGQLVIDIVHGGTNGISFTQTQDAEFEL